MEGSNYWLQDSEFLSEVAVNHLKKAKRWNLAETSQNYQDEDKKSAMNKKKNGHGDTSSNLDETDCIPHSTYTLWKGMNPIILPPAMGK